MRAYIILAAVAVGLAAPAVAQNTKGTGAEDKTTTTTNPIGTSINGPPTAPHGHDRAPDTPIDRGNPTATKNSQAPGDSRKGVLGK
jgi:hypothetical protein